VRKSLFIPLLLVAILALAACGGGGSSSSSQTATPSEEAPNEGGAAEEPAKAATPEEAWAKEVTDVMSEFENKVAANLTEEIHTSTSQPHLEPLYSTYSTNLSVLGNKLESTDAKGACVAVRAQMVKDVREVAALTKTLASDRKLNPEQYAAKGYTQGQKIDKIGHHLGTLTLEPKC
jgi:hypothetical protein